MQFTVRMARENPGWGYDRIAGALSNLGHKISDQTVGNILHRHGIAPAPKRSQSTTWKKFIAAHVAVLAGTDFFTVEVPTRRSRHLPGMRSTLKAATYGISDSFSMTEIRNSALCSVPSWNRRA